MLIMIAKSLQICSLWRFIRLDSQSSQFNLSNAYNWTAACIVYINTINVACSIAAMPLKTPVCWYHKIALWMQSHSIWSRLSSVIVEQDSATHRSNLEIHQAGCDKPWVNRSWRMSLSLLSRQRPYTWRDWLYLQWLSIEFLENFLSITTNSFVCNTFPWS